MSYTKGKWFVNKDGYTISTDIRGSCYIAQVHPFDCEKSDNAKLIVAAPDLLAACKEAKQLLSALSVHFEVMGHIDSVNLCLYEAIHKAESEA